MNARLSTVQALSGDIGAGSLILNDYALDITQIDRGYRLTVTRGSETQTMDVLDGQQGVQGPQGEKGDTGAVGPQGEPGQDAPQDVVRYAMQSLDADQQMQARENIGAADAEAVNGLKDDLAAITPDDSAVDGKPWTSGKIVEALCPPFETTSSIVQCHPVEHYPLGVVSRIEPIQSGSGDASPDNIRPIVGWDAVQIVNSNDAGETNTYTAELPETIYGGELDWNTGVLTVDRAIDVKTSGDIRESASGTQFVTPAKYDCAIAYYSPCNCLNGFFHTGAFYRADKSDTGYETLTELQEALGDTPIQLCYKLETPYTVQLTPQQITALTGINTLYTDSGDTAVSGRADPVWLTQSLMERIAALESAATNI